MWLNNFSTSTKGWRRPWTLTLSGPFRLCPIPKNFRSTKVKKATAIIENKPNKKETKIHSAKAPLAPKASILLNYKWFSGVGKFLLLGRNQTYWCTTTPNQRKITYCLENSYTYYTSWLLVLCTKVLCLINNQTPTNTSSYCWHKYIL